MPEYMYTDVVLQVIFVLLRCYSLFFLMIVYTSNGKDGAGKSYWEQKNEKADYLRRGNKILTRASICYASNFFEARLLSCTLINLCSLSVVK